MDLHTDILYMSQALKLAEKARKAEEVPVGALIVHGGRVIARSYNQVELLHDATAHAEMLALTQAQAELGNWRLNECDLYVTKEPCVMCAGAIMHCRVKRVIYGCPDPKAGAAGGGFINLLQHPSLNHSSEITTGVLLDECRSILLDFFNKRRLENKLSRATEPTSDGSPPVDN